MISFFLLSLPIFGIVAIGWLATRLKIVDTKSLDALTAYSFQFALPALVFRLVAMQPLGDLFNPTFYSGYLASGGLIFALVFALSRAIEHRTPAAAAGHAAVSTVGNLGFFGPPFMLAFFGERGAGPLAMAILSEVMVLLSVGGIIMGMTRGGGDGVAKSVIRSAALNPVFLGIVGGAVFAATGLSLPGPAERFLSFLGNSSGPTALFALGGMLAVQRIDRSVASIAVFVTAAKLAIYPALVWLVLSQVLRLDNFLVQAAVLMASLPSAGSVFVLAQRFDGDADGVSAGTVLSTMVSVATVPLATWLVFHA